MLGMRKDEETSLPSTTNNNLSKYWIRTSTVVVQGLSEVNVNVLFLNNIMIVFSTEWWYNPLLNSVKELQI